MLLGPLELMVSACASALFGWTITHVRGGLRARRARATLGNALDRVPESGGAVTLRGRLEVRAQRCQRFADQAAAAVATATGEPVQGAPPAEVSVRAEVLVLHVGGVPVLLEGPVRVVAGSHEKVAGSKVAPPRGGVLERIGAVDSEVAWSLWSRPRRVLLRSLADGDRVRVAGVLRRADAPVEGMAQGYREAGAPWCLVPASEEGGEPGSGSMVAAFEGAPGGPAVYRAMLAAGALGTTMVTIAALLIPALPPPRALTSPCSPQAPTADTEKSRRLGPR